MTKASLKAALKKQDRWSIENSFILNLSWEFFKGGTMTEAQLLTALKLDELDIKMLEYDEMDKRTKEAKEVLEQIKEEKKKLDEEKKEFNKLLDSAINE